MNDYIRQCYENSRNTFLENVAYMDRTNEEYAEQNGGVGNLNEQAKRIYEGRKTRIIRLVAYHDRSQELIEDLQDWIGELIQENRRLSNQVKNTDQAWKKHFPIQPTESQREHQRSLSILQAHMQFPQLF